MFERPHHQRIAQVLDSFDAPIFLNPRCLFGGGTAVALLHGEFRESVDIDFICSSVDGYRELRSLVTQGGIAALQRTPIAVLREPRFDHYGIRCAFVVLTLTAASLFLHHTQVPNKNTAQAASVVKVMTMPKTRKR